MILDKTQTYADGLDLRTVGDVVSTNVLDEGVDHDIGPGSRVWLVAAVTSPMAGGGSIRAHLETSDTADFASSSRVYSSEYMNAASMNDIGEFAKFVVPPGMKRFSRVVFEIAGANFTAGSVWAGIVKDVDMRREYPDRLNITGR